MIPYKTILCLRIAEFAGRGLQNHFVQANNPGFPNPVSLDLLADESRETPEHPALSTRHRTEQ